jgi:glycosyltransferase involved in cell wall biosynthesis
MDSPKLKLAYFSPFNPIQSGISDYSEDLLPTLAAYSKLDLYLDNYKPSNERIGRDFKVHPYTHFSRQVASGYDAWLFHMGNSAAHTYIYEQLQQHKGNSKAVLVLHDFVLHHFLIGYYLNRGKASEYIRLMQASYGDEGAQIAQAVLRGKLPEALFQFSLSDAALEAASAVIVHSHYAANLIRQRLPNKNVGIVRMGVPLPPLIDRATARTRLGLAQDEFILTSLGHLNPYKRLDSALWAFKAFNREYPASRYLLIGSLSPNYDVKAMLRGLGLENKVQVVGFASDSAYQDYLAASDVCINLRYPTAGETSASLLRIMGAARPVLVSRTGAFEELPDATCIKVDVDEAEEELLLEYLRLLKRDQALRLQLGLNARQYVATHARLEDSAYDYYAFLAKVTGQPSLIAPPLSEFLEVDTRQTSPTIKAAPSIETIETEEVTTLHTPQTQLQPNQTTTVASSSLVNLIAQAAHEVGLDENSAVLEEVAVALDFVQKPPSSS